MKALLILSLLVTALPVWSKSESPIISVKERLRLHLWYQGLSGPIEVKSQSKKPLPEELERALRKI